MSAILHDPALGLAESWQRDFPLCPRPYAEIGRAHGLTEQETIELFAELADRGALGRIGAAVRPNTAGASTLGALAAPAGRLGDIAAMVSAEPAVTHNYQREHTIDLWFVITAANRAAVEATLTRIEHATGCEVLDLPLQRAYHIDLGFGLSGSRRKQCETRTAACEATLDNGDRTLLSILRDGFALAPRPYQHLARALDWPESEVIARLKRLVEAGVISRLGCILRHRRIGITANAMAVWDVPDDAVDAIAEQLAQSDAVNLCYRRQRRLPHWPYNLFAMVHGRERGTVKAEIAAASYRAGLSSFPSAVLFSKHCFKQEGAHFGHPARKAA